MEGFLDDFDSWFHRRYFLKPKKRYWPFKIALNILLQRGGKRIVETGCVRQKNDWGGGMSTLIFAAFCHRYGKKLYSVDIDPEAIATATKVTELFRNNIEFKCQDSVEYLKKFPHEIDLLYLDSMDCDVRPEADNRAAQEHQLAELNAAWANLHVRSIVLLDDNNFINGGKTILTKEALRQSGWLELLTWKCSLWIKGP